MALQYFIYRTDFGNTIIRTSATNTSTGGTEQALFTNFSIPAIQPVYLWRVVGISVQPNLENNITNWEQHIAPAPSSNDNVNYGQLTGATTPLYNDIQYISGITDTKASQASVATFTGTTLPANYYNKTQINAYSGQTNLLIAEKVNVSGDTMTGDLSFAPSSDPTAVFGKIGKSTNYSGLKLEGLAGISLNTPYWVNPQWSGYTGSYLTVGIDGLITLTTPPTGATSWQTTGGTNSIVANVPEDLGIVVVPNQNVEMGTIQWNISFTNSTNQSANVSLQAVVNSNPYPDKINYVIEKNQTSKLFGSIPISTTILSGTSLDIRITSNKNGVVNNSLLRLSETGSGTEAFGLQQVTEVGAITNIETTFSGGLVTGQIRPAIDGTTAFQINNVSNNTIINVDTVSGFTGFGTVTPFGLIHAFGTDNIDTLIGTETNMIAIDGTSDVDKDIAWFENGVPKWLGETYRSENSEYWYLYSVPANNAPLTIRQTGRIGVNKVTNLLDYHATQIVGTGLNDIFVSGVYEQNYDTVYRVAIVANGNPDMFQWAKSLDDGLTFSSFSSSSGVTTTPLELEYGVNIQFSSITGHTVGNVWQFVGFTQIPQGTFTIAPMGIQEVLVTDDYTVPVPVYNDVTTLANGAITGGKFVFKTGTGSTLQTLTWGTTVPNTSIYFTFFSGGTSLTLVVEYWNGTMWVALSPVNNFLIDGTDNATHSGRIIWETNTMPDWIQDLIPGGDADLYWMRLRTSTNVSTPPVGQSMSVGNNIRLGVYNAFNSIKPSFYVDSIGRVNIGGGNITGGNILQVNPYPNLPVATGGKDSIVEFDSENSAITDLKIKLSTDSACDTGILLVNTRGTLTDPQSSQSGDYMGHIEFRGRFNTAGSMLAKIQAQLTGSESCRNGDLMFSTAYNCVMHEVVRVTSSGTTGFGLTYPTAIVHVKSGTTTTAPLKLTSGNLLTTPQAGALEFRGNKWYGTSTGNTRNTFAFLESPQFVGTPNLPIGTTLNSINLNTYISNSGGTNNPTLVKTISFNTYTGNSQPILNSAVTGATNGLTKSGRNVLLGGNLTQNTTITGGTFDFILSTKSLNLLTNNCINITDTSVQGVHIRANGGPAELHGNTSSGIEKTKISLSETTAVFTDARAIPTGLQYNADYSGTFTDRSLVDKGYVDTTAGGLHPKAAVQLATTTGITLSGNQTIDGVLTTTGMRVLVKNQASGTTNGTYNASSGVWTRTSDFDGTPSGEVVNNSYFFVLSGNTNANTSWILTTPNPIVVGVDVLTFQLFSATNGVTAGNGICVTQSGGNFDVAVKLAANCGLCVDSSGLRINNGISGVGLCYASGIMCLDGAGIAGNSLSWTGTKLAVNTTGGTLSTALNSKASQASVATYTGTTAPNTYLSKTAFNTYSGNTNTTINSKASQASVATYTGTTAPNTYVAKTQFNVYTGSTNTILSHKAELTGATFTGIVRGITPATNDNTTCFATTAWYISQGATALPLINGTAACGTSNLFARQDHVHPTDTTRLAVSAFNTYSGNTQTAINSKASQASVATFTGTTLPANYYNKTQINAYTGATNTLINSKASQASVATYTGNTRTELNLTVTGTTNLGTANTLGAKSGRNITLKSISGGTGISISNTANVVTICSSINSANKQIIFNNNGVLTGNTNLTYCTTCGSIQIGSGSVASGALSVAFAGGQAIGSRSMAHGSTNNACAPNSIVIGGSGNTTCSGALRSAIIGSCGISLTGSTYNDTVAVRRLAIWQQTTGATISGDYTLLWNATDKKVKAIKLTGGSDCYIYKESATATCSSSATCVMYISASSANFLAGRYQVDFDAQIGNSANGGTTLLKFACDNTVIGNSNLCYNSASNAGGHLSASMSRDLTLTSGCHCFTVHYWAGANTACIYSAMIRAKRIC